MYISYVYTKVNTNLCHFSLFCIYNPLCNNMFYLNLSYVSGANYIINQFKNIGYSQTILGITFYKQLYILSFSCFFTMSMHIHFVFHHNFAHSVFWLVRFSRVSVKIEPSKKEGGALWDGQTDHKGTTLTNAEAEEKIQTWKCRYEIKNIGNIAAMSFVN